MLKKCHKKEHQKGFTLVELVVVLVVIGVLAAFAVPAFGRYIEKTHEAQAIAEARAFGLATQTGFSAWYCAPDSHQPTGAYDKTNKSELALSMKDLLKKECGMQAADEARIGSNKYQVVSSDMTEAKWADWCKKALQNRGKNRGVFYVKSVNNHYESVAGVAYLSKDGKYVVRIIYELGEKDCDFTEDDIGVYVQKIS